LGAQAELRKSLPRHLRVFCLSVSLVDITRANERQLDIVLDYNKERRSRGTVRVSLIYDDKTEGSVGGMA